MNRFIIPSTRHLIVLWTLMIFFFLLHTSVHRRNFSSLPEYIQWHRRLFSQVPALKGDISTLTWHCPNSAPIGLGDRLHGVAYTFQLAVSTGRLFVLASGRDDYLSQFSYNAFNWRASPGNQRLISASAMNFTIITPVEDLEERLKLFSIALRDDSGANHRHICICTNLPPTDLTLFRKHLRLLFDNKARNYVSSLPDDMQVSVAIHARTGLSRHEQDENRFRHIGQMPPTQFANALLDCAQQHMVGRNLIFFATDSPYLSHIAVTEGRRRNMTVIHNTGRTSGVTRAVTDWWGLTMAKDAVITTKSAFSSSSFAMGAAKKLVRVRAWKRKRSRTRCEVLVSLDGG